MNPNPFEIDRKRIAWQKKGIGRYLGDGRGQQRPELLLRDVATAAVDDDAADADRGGGAQGQRRRRRVRTRRPPRRRGADAADAADADAADAADAAGRRSGRNAGARRHRTRRLFDEALALDAPKKKQKEKETR